MTSVKAFTLGHRTRYSDPQGTRLGTNGAQQIQNNNYRAAKSRSAAIAEIIKRVLDKTHSRQIQDIINPSRIIFTVMNPQKPLPLQLYCLRYQAANARAR